MPRYDHIIIQNFFLTRLPNLEHFCFYFSTRMQNKNFSYGFLAGGNVQGKIISLINTADALGYTGELVFYTVVEYWLEELHGSCVVLQEEGILDQLGIYLRELSLRSPPRKERIDEIQKLLRKHNLPLPELKQLLQEPQRPRASGNQLFRRGYAVLVGVGQQQYTGIHPLPVTVKDVDAIYNVLTDPGKCAYPAANVRVLRNEKATRSAILAELEWLAEQDQSATAIFYFSGHGGKIERGGSSRYCLVPYDFNRDDMDNTAVYDDVLKEKLTAIHAQRMVVILDACHAGGLAIDAKDGFLPEGFSKTAPSPDIIKRLNSGSGRVILSSSQEGEKSYILSDHSRSVFTDCFIQALSGKAPTLYDKEIGILDVFNYLDFQVPISVEEEQCEDPYTGMPALQHPVLDSVQANNFPIALR